MKIAIIGSGISGLYSSYYLQKKLPNSAQITLFEKEGSIGGHTAPLLVSEGDKEFWMDTAFLIFNSDTYPLFNSLLSEWGLDEFVIPAEMTSTFNNSNEDFSFKMGASLSDLFIDKRNILNPKLYQLLIEIIRFRRNAIKAIDATTSDTTIGQFLSSYSDNLKNNFIFPLCSSIWSIPFKELEKYPLKSILSYFDNHGILRGNSRRSWKTLKGSSRIYLDKFLNNNKSNIKYSEEVLEIFEERERVKIKTNVDDYYFDYVICATHADIAFRIIKNQDRKDLLSSWKYHPSLLYLHQDKSFLFSKKSGWSSWNTSFKGDDFYITYYLNKVQSIDSEKDYFLTLSQNPELEPKDLIHKGIFRHPVFTTESIKSQIPIIQNFNGRLLLAGSYLGYGFHEDGINSAKQACDSLLSQTSSFE